KKASTIAHNRQKTCTIKMSMCVAMRAVSQYGLNLLSLRSIRRLASRHYNTDVVAISITAGISHINIWKHIVTENRIDSLLHFDDRYILLITIVMIGKIIR